MAPRADDSPTELPPPSYQLSQEHFDRKTSHAIQLSSSIHQPIIDQDGWPIYDAGAFEAVAKSYGQSSSSAGPPGTDIPRQTSFASLPPPTDPMKSRSSDRRRRNHNPDRDFPPEPRDATPPPPFTPTGPSLDGPPFDEVVTISYSGTDPSTQNRRTSRSPVTQPIAPGRSQRFSDSQFRTQTQPPPNPYHSHRPASMQPDIPSRLIPASTITRVEFDPQMAYSPNGRNGNHTPMHQGGASAFYNHAVASQLTANPTTTPSPQTGYPPDRISSPYSSGYSAGNTFGRYQATSPVSHLTPDERYTTLPQGHRLSTPASLPSSMVSSPSLPSGAGYPQPPSGAVRGPLPPVPYSQWAGSEAQLVQDIYGGNG